MGRCSTYRETARGWWYASNVVTKNPRHHTKTSKSPRDHTRTPSLRRLGKSARLRQSITRRGIRGRWSPKNVQTVLICTRTRRKCSCGARTRVPLFSTRVHRASMVGASTTRPRLGRFPQSGIIITRRPRRYRRARRRRSRPARLLGTQSASPAVRSSAW